MGCGASVPATVSEPAVQSMQPREAICSQQQTGALALRFEIDAAVWCRIMPEGWVNGKIVKRNFDENAFHIELKATGEVVHCPVDSAWYVRDDRPSEEEIARMDQNKQLKPRRFALTLNSSLLLITHKGGSQHIISSFRANKII